MNFSDISPVIQTFLQSRDLDKNHSISLAGTAGSQRLYYRIQKNMVSYILMVCPKEDGDFGRFLRLTQFYRLLEFPVPQVYCIDDSNLQVLLEDLGDLRLFDIIHARPGDTLKRYQQVIDNLLFLQTRCFHLHHECPDIFSRNFDYDDLRWETNYFSQEYLIRYKGQYKSKTLPKVLDKEFHRLAETVKNHPRTIMHRDFQSQNIMVQNEKIRIIDYQGSRLGSKYYDLASLLIDPYVNLPDTTIDDLFAYFYAKSLIQSPLEEAFSQFLQTAAQRIMQALGAFCFLSRVKKLNYFKQFIEPGEQRLLWILERASLYNLKKLIT
ncbi:MAG: phosphotransferase [Fibrobacteria bacterium]|nr:phosphotransferase [Fibrobacteria bacterium]